MNETEIKVAEYLAAQGIKFRVTGGTPTTRDDWECDAWQFTFSRAGKVDIIDQYYTGIGHRKLTKMGEAWIKREGRLMPNRLARLKAEYSKPVAPSSASVLYSILLDASGAEQNFRDWCDSFGSDPDSIKQWDIYDTCCKMLGKVRDFFTHAERAELQLLLEDY